MPGVLAMARVGAADGAGKILRWVLKAEKEGRKIEIRKHMYEWHACAHME